MNFFMSILIHIDIEKTTHNYFRIILTVIPLKIKVDYAFLIRCS